MNELISVIVPIYKVEKYIHRCINSILYQTYSNLEIILVDDGSPDHCGEICDEFAKHDDRIKVYHKVNGGLSDARNYGVVRSSGKYIAFVDSDDYIAPNYIEYLYNLIDTHQADISGCYMIKTYSDEVEYCIQQNLPDVRILSGYDASKCLLNDLYTVLVTAWGKLYKREVVEANPFPVGRIHEDEATTCKYYYDSKRVVVGNQCLYAYYQNPDSIMRSVEKIFDEDKFWSLSHRAEYYESKKEIFLAKCAWEILVNRYIDDSKQNNGRCDKYLKGFSKGKHLFQGTKRRLFFYNISPKLYEGYIKLKSILLR